MPGKQTTAIEPSKYCRTKANSSAERNKKKNYKKRMRSFWFSAERVPRRRWLGDNCGQKLNLLATTCTWIHHLTQTIARLFTSFLDKQQPFVSFSIFFLLPGSILVDSSAFWNTALLLVVILISFSLSFSFVHVYSMSCEDEHVDMTWLFCWLPETIGQLVLKGRVSRGCCELMDGKKKGRERVGGRG